ncbi:MAG: CHAT domain-containing protein [Longimicrobiaceae bacterium]
MGPPRPLSRAVLRTLATAAALASAALPCACARGGDGTPASRLVDVLLAERFTAGRLTGQVEWEACAAVDSTALVPRVRCGTPLRPGTPRHERRDEAERDLDRSPRDSSVAGLRAGAFKKLLYGDTAVAPRRRAVESLERARRLAPADPGVLNDLAVAYLALGERTQQLEPMLRALDAVERAVLADSLDVAILFNRALVHQRLYQVESAKRAWARYLEVEPDSLWRAEARELAARVARIPDVVRWDTLPASPGGDPLDAAARAAIAARVRKSPQAAREFCFGLLGRWGAAVRGGHEDSAARHLALAREIGEAAVREGLDPGVALAVRRIDAASGSTRERAALAEAHVELARGFAEFYVPDHKRAAASLARAEGWLRAAGSPAARWAAFYRGAAEISQAGYDGADLRFQTVLAEATPDEQALIGRAVWAQGVTQVRRGNYEAATRLYRGAVPHIDRAREPDNQGTLAYLLAESLGLAGQTRAGQAEALRGLRLLAPFRSSIHLNNHLATVATYARGDGLSHASLAITGEVLEVSRAIGKADLQARAHRARARDLLALGRCGERRAHWWRPRDRLARRRCREASALLEEGLRWAGRLPAGDARDRVSADVMLVQGQMARTEDPRKALRLLTGVVKTYRRGRITLHMPVALYEAGLAAEAAGDPAGARARLHEAIGYIERQQAAFESIEGRATFHETVENVFDATLRMAIQAGEWNDAFEYLERARIAIQPVPGRKPGEPPPPGTGIAELGALLPADVLFADYAVLPDRLVVWTVSRRGRRYYSVPVGRDSVAAMVRRFTEQLGEPESNASQARAALFELLLRRPLKREPKASRLVVVPDRELYLVPFAALWNRRTGRYVVEDREVTTVPSATFYAAASAQAHGDRRRMSALVVGNPSLEPELARRLENLPGAFREAERVAPLYGRHRLLRGPEAGRRAVTGLLPSHSVFHFAGHAVFDGEQPGSSYLALAADGANGSGILRAREIGDLRLSNVELAVLSACSTLSPRPSRAGAAAGLAYSFLRAGVPATVSTVWDVDDAATTGVLVEFHRWFAGGASAAGALRQAQIQALRSPRAEVRIPEAWAAFVYTGP